MSEKRNVPKLRFPFKDVWLEKTIGEIAPLQRGFDLPVSQIEEGEFPVVFSNGILKYHTQFKVKAPGVVTGRSGTIGNVTIVEKDFWPHNTSLWVTDFLGNEPGFIYYFYIWLNLEKYGSGSGVPTLNRNDIHILKKHIPSLPEQQKIAEFLTAVDRRIELLQAKKEKLETYKKGVMQKIFSQKLRFKADDGSDFPDWEERKLGDLGDFYGGGTPDSTKEHLWTGDIPWVSSSDISEDSIYKVSKTRFITEQAIAESATKKIPPKSVLIVTRVGVGKIAYCEEGVCTSQDFSSLAPVTGFNPVFLAYCLTFNSTKIKSLSQGTSIKGVTLDDLKNLRMWIPSEGEQKKIVQFLTNLDRSIENLNQQITHTQTWKKGLLQKMFV